MASINTKTSPPPPYSSSPASTQTSSNPPTITTAPIKKTCPKQQRKYKTSIPLYRLTRFAAPTDCPICGQRAMTRIEYVISPMTHVLAVSFFFSSVVLFWLPYALKAMKNINHHCGNPECGVLLATWHRAPAPGCIEVKEFS